MVKLNDCHQKLWSSFKVEETEPLDYWEELPEPIETLEHPTFRSLKWVCYSWKDVKGSLYLYGNYRKLLQNFEYERDFFDEKEGFARMWFFFSTTFKKGMIETGKFYPLGFLGIQENEKTNKGTPTIQVAWLHPYLRGYGLMKYLCYHLSNQDAHAMEPPVSLSMHFAMVNAVGMMSKEEVDSLRNKSRLSVQKRHNIDLSQFSDKEFEKVATMLNLMPSESITQEAMNQFLKVFRNPEFKDQVDWVFPDQNQNDRNRIMKEYHMHANLNARGV